MAVPPPRHTPQRREVTPLQLVGYWHADVDDGLPHPQQLVHPRWEWRRRRGILRYLESGTTSLQYRGFSYCRFGCRRFNGTRDLTDGTWVWPEGLAHYVRMHGVSLPEALVDHMAANDFRVPSSMSPVHHSMEVSDDFWREWASQQGRHHAIACCYACREARGAAPGDWPAACRVPFRWAIGWLWYHVGWKRRAR